MKIRLGYQIVYECPQPVPMILMLSIRPEREADLLSPQTLEVDRDVPVHRYTDGFGNVCHRLVAPAGVTSFRSDFLIHDTGEWDAPVDALAQHPVEDLPDGVLVYLLGSRYCETDKLSDLAWAQFGHLPPGGARVAAILTYAKGRIEFGYHHARRDHTAWTVHEACTGVCRDYAHLGVTLCRAMNIPARYVTGYLGDIGVPISPDAMDFSGWFEVYLSGAWHTVDARHNRPRVGRVLMGVGRDATDVALATTFGVANLVGFKVISDEIV